MITRGLRLLCLLVVLAGCTSNQPNSFEFEDAQLAFRIKGKGEPVLVLPGGPGFGARYVEDGLGRLSEHFQVIYLDPRGTGDSTGIDDPSRLTQEQLVRDIEALRQHLGISKWTLVGHSFGATLAAEYSLDHSESVARLVLLTPGWFSIQDKRRVVQELSHRMGSELPTPEPQTDPVTGFQRIAELALQHYFCDPSLVTQLDLHLDEKGVEAFYAFQAAFEAEPRRNISEELSQLPMPTLIVAGGCDLVEPSVGLEAHSLIPDSEYLLIEDSGHYPWLEGTTVDVVEEIVAFLYRHQK